MKKTTTYSETLRRQDIRDTRKQFIQRSVKYLEKNFDFKFREEIEFIHKRLMKGDYYN